MATRRQKIMTLISGYLSNITVANGYKTTVASVHHWKAKAEPKANSTILNLKDELQEYTTERREALHITIEVACKTSTNYTTITNLFQDIHKCLEDNLANIKSALSNCGTVYIENLEDAIVDISTETDAETIEGYVSIILTHRITEKTDVDETSY